jgi:secreted trypsin-like serine protease
MLRFVGLGFAVLLCALPAPAQAVVGGASVPEGGAPYAVALLAGGGHGLEDWQRVFCGGTLVGPRTVLTAAHCARPGTEVLAAGTNLLDDAGRRYRVVATDVHPGFDRATFRNDVALLTLPEPVAAAPVALVAPGEEALWAPGTPATVLGWGNLSEHQSSQTAWLQAGTLPVLPDDACGGLVDPATQFCAGPPASSVDACQGDSGGPLVITAGARTVQVGIVSSGRGCGRSPGVYTRLGAPGVAGWIGQRLGAASVLAAASGEPRVRATLRSVRRVRGGRVVVRGRVVGARPGMRVLVQRRAGGTWVTAVRAPCSAGGRFRAVFRSSAVRPRVRVLVA